MLRTMRQWIDLGVLALVAVDSAEACKGILTVDVHGTRSTNTLTARATEG